MKRRISLNTAGSTSSTSTRLVKFSFVYLEFAKKITRFEKHSVVNVYALVNSFVAGKLFRVFYSKWQSSFGRDYLMDCLDFHFQVDLDIGSLVKQSQNSF